MTGWPIELEAASVLARQPGDILVPSGLLTYCSGLGDPVTMLMGPDSWQEIFAALDPDLGFVWPVRHGNVPITDEQRQKLAGAMRWLMANLRDWRKANDPKNAALVAIIVVACRLDEDGALWKLLPDEAGGNIELSQELARLLGTFRINLDLRPTKSPISEGEELEGFLKAEADKDWAGLRRLAEGVAFQALTNVLVSQSMRALQRFFPALLVQVARAVPQIGIAMQMATSISVEDALDLAAQSGNDFMQFASVCRLFNTYAPVHELDAAQEAALDSVLTAVAKEFARWAAWMRAFVAHPYQTSQMQAAIGRALAGADNSALQAYFDALVVQSNWLGREEVAATLEAFASNVTPERRQNAWRMAFARWSNWDFEAAQGSSRLTAISLSSLDFAVVGYAVECLTPEERDALVDACLGDLQRTELRWHKSQREFMEHTYRVMSRLQPLAHARTVGADRRRWLRDKDADFLLDRFGQPFWMQRYHLQEKPAWYAPVTGRAPEDGL